MSAQQYQNLVALTTPLNKNKDRRYIIVLAPIGIVPIKWYTSNANQA